MTKAAADRHREGYKHWDMVLLGWKYNMDNIQAALLLPQMDRLEANWQKRQALARRYWKGLATCTGVSWPRCQPGVKHAHHLFTVWVVPNCRDLVVQRLQERGISVLVNYRAIHLLTYLRERLGHKPGDFPNAERIGDSTMSLPFYANMPTEHVDEVIDALREVIRGERGTLTPR